MACKNLVYIDGSQEERLFNSNLTENDIQLKAILDNYNLFFGIYDTLINRLIKSDEKYQNREEVILNENGIRRKR